MQRSAISNLAGRGLTRLNGSKCITGNAGRTVARAPLQTNISPLRLPFLLPPSQRTFSSTPSLHKKKQPQKSNSNKDLPGMTPPDPSTDSLTNKPDIFNHSKLQSSITSITTRFKDEVSRARSFAGKIDPKIFEDLTVELKKSTKEINEQYQQNVKQHGEHPGSKSSGKIAKSEKHRLKELAHVAQKTGKEVMITVHEPRYVDLVAATVMEILGMNAQHTSTPNVLRVEIPPPTVESRQQSAKEVQQMFNSAKLKLDTLKRDTHKEFRAKQKDYQKEVLKRAEKETLTMLGNAEEEMKKICDSTKKMIEG